MSDFIKGIAQLTVSEAFSEMAVDAARAICRIRGEGPQDQIEVEGIFMARWQAAILEARLIRFLGQ